MSAPTQFFAWCNMFSKTFKGITLALIAGICWGSMGVAAQYLMAHCQFTVFDLTSIRLFGAGALLVAIDFAVHGKKHARQVLDSVNLRSIIIYGLILVCSQSTFFLSISNSNAATATILVLTSPLFVIAYMAIRHHRRIKPLELVALVFAMIGVLLIVTKGHFDSVDFSIAGVGFGLLSAMFGAMGTIQPANVVRRLTVIPVIGWAMLIVGFVACLFNNPFTTDAIWSTRAVLSYSHVVIFGTITAFCCYLKSMEFIAPSTASMLTCSEPLSAVILSVLLLGTTFGIVEGIGALCIVMTVLLLAKSKA